MDMVRFLQTKKMGMWDVSEQVCVWKLGDTSKIGQFLAKVMMDQWILGSNSDGMSPDGIPIPID